MSVASSIEWTDATYNPWRGCDKVSPGCAHCYMFTDQRRYGRDPSVVVRCSPSTFFAPVRSAKWRELPEGALVFTCSWSDWFHEDADSWRDEAWDVIRQRPDLRWQILTKRPERILEHLPPDWGAGWPNVWMGVTIENRRFVSRADVLREVPAAVRFISAEPLLGPVIARGATFDRRDDGPASEFQWRWRDGYVGPELNLDGIDWIILGGESGPGARRTDPDWMHEVVRAATGTVTAVFVKQLGKVLGRELGLADWAKGGGESIDNWPADLQVRQMPGQPLAEYQSQLDAARERLTAAPTREPSPQLSIDDALRGVA